MNLTTRFVLSIAMYMATGAALADPSTAPSTQPLSIAAQVSLLQDQFETRTAEQMLDAYSIHDDQQREMARVYSAEAVATSRLVKLARQRWGENAEIAVAHACGTDSRADDATAHTVIDGDHATITFNTDAISQFLLVREQGRWLIDMPGYVRLMGPDFQKALTAERGYIPIYTAASDKLSKGQYASADALVAELIKQSAAIGQ